MQHVAGAARNAVAGSKRSIAEFHVPDVDVEVFFDFNMSDAEKAALEKTKSDFIDGRAKLQKIHRDLEVGVQLAERVVEDAEQVRVNACWFLCPPFLSFLRCASAAVVCC
jgi:hypothetical protein